MDQRKIKNLHVAKVNAWLKELRSNTALTTQVCFVDELSTAAQDHLFPERKQILSPLEKRIKELTEIVRQQKQVIAVLQGPVIGRKRQQPRKKKK